MRKVSLNVKKNFDLKKRLPVIFKGNYKAFLIGGSEEVIKDNISNILHQKTPSGGTLKKNAPATIKRKMQLGKGRLSLVWDRILISRKTWFHKTTKKRARIFLTAARSKISRALRKMGYEHFAISPKARVRIFRRWRDFIKRGLR
jgi:hypothetical protein